MRQASSDTWRKTVRARKVPEKNLLTRGASERSAILRPNNVATLMATLDPDNNRPTPLRPAGAGSAATGCITAAGGTLIDMTGFDETFELGESTVTVGTGMELCELATRLAEVELEVAGCMDLPTRTVGGALSSACIGPAIGQEGSQFASQIVALSAITPAGKLMRVTERRRDLISVFRLSYGLLGAVFEVTLKTRPIRKITSKHKKLSTAEFGSACAELAGRPLGVKFYMLPFRDQVYAEIRRYDENSPRNNRLRRKIRDWGETTVLPGICDKLHRIVPIASVRYSLVDGIAGASQGLLQNRQVGGTSPVDEQLSQSSSRNPRPPLNYSTWCFALSDAPMVLPAYQAFCKRYYKQHKYRCDMPAVGFKVATDRSALLSPSFDEPMIALRAISNPHPSWQDFALEYSGFAEQWNGIPLFNQSVNVDMTYAASAYGSRLDFFRRIRRQLDPDNRLLNPYLAQYFC